MAVAVRGYAAAPAGEPEQAILMDRRDWPAWGRGFVTRPLVSGLAGELARRALRRAG